MGTNFIAMVYATTTQASVDTGAILTKVEDWAVKTFNIPTSVGDAKTLACTTAETAIKKEIDADLAVATAGTTSIITGISNLFNKDPIGDAESKILDPIMSKLGC